MIKDLLHLGDRHGKIPNRVSFFLSERVGEILRTEYPGDECLAIEQIGRGRRDDVSCES